MCVKRIAIILFVLALLIPSSVLGRAEGKMKTAVTVGTSSSNQATSFPNQRKVFFAATRYWVFYEDAAAGNMVYTSSLNGTAWAAKTTASTETQYGYMASVWWDGTYIHYARVHEDNHLLYYKRGTPASNGVITWTAEQTAVDAGEYYVERPSVCVCTDGKPVISYNYYTSVAHVTPYVTKAGNNDGTWGEPSLAPTKMDVWEDATWNTSVVPLTGGDFMVLWGCDGSSISSNIYDSSEATWLGEDSVAGTLQDYECWNVLVTSDNVVHLVYERLSTKGISYTHYHSGGTEWETEETLYDGTVDFYGPALAKTTNDDLICFWSGDPSSLVVYYKYCGDNTWGATVAWLTLPASVQLSLLNCAYEQGLAKGIPLIWMADNGPTYDVKFIILQGKNPLPAFRPSKDI